MKRAFTLIEVLVVIAIILVLAGLLLPTITRSVARAERLRAEAECRAIAQALQAYYHDYARWPVTNFTGASLTLELDEALYGILRGSNVNFAVAGTFQSTNRFAGNSQGRIYLKTERRGLDATTGRLLDAWGNTWMVRLDTSETHQLADPFGGAAALPADILVWSAGPDRQWTNTAATINQDNIKSW